MKYLTTKEFEILRDRFPDAYSFLLSANLRNERESLTRELEFLDTHENSDSRRKKWVENRVKELNTLAL